ncbi:hypothetical protein ACFQ22_02005 [Lentilactobacillus raoultii]|uniref:Uncharacterized protein n=1 Tax=Lentilactobacillus raoultii TaxID=1987503 RepID=A0ABW3PFV6_9LACO|nr:hypothetical protein [Lentilactobacillus raoultii]
MLDKKRLISIFNEMGYEVEFNSGTPGIVVNGHTKKWADIPVIPDEKTSKVKHLVKIRMSPLTKVPLANFANQKLTAKSYNFFLQKYQNNSSKVWPTMA